MRHLIDHIRNKIKIALDVFNILIQNKLYTITMHDWPGECLEIKENILI